MKYGVRALISALVGGVAAGSAAAQSSGPVAVYWVSAATTTGMQGMGGMGGFGGGPPRGMGAGGYGGASGQRQGPPPQAQAPRRPGLGSMLGAAVGGGLGGFGPFGRPQPQAQDDSEGAGNYRGGMPPGLGGYGGGGDSVSHSLELQLGSTQSPTGAPQAAHFVPPGLRAGESLPLVTPQVRPPEPPEPGSAPQMGQRPKGRMLIYWGCGEHAQGPITIDFAKISASSPPNIPFIAANPGRPPSAGRYATYGQWPNERSSVSIPPGGSLVGEHTIRGDYSPDIHFALAPGQDFLGPLNIVSREPTPAGATRVSWTAVPGATGYFAWMIGAQERGETVVMWSSGSAANMMGALTDYLPPGEVRRLVAQGAVMSPETTTCVVPSEVIKASPFGMLSMIAYGQESDFADPPRPQRAGAPWNLRWTVKVRRKSTTSALLGMPGGRD